MAGVRDKQLVTLTGFPVGVNNTDGETELARDQNGTLIALREAVNTNLSTLGKPSRRGGYALVAAGAMHSGWSDDYLSFGLLVDGDALKAVQSDESMDVLVSGLAPGLPLSYCRINDAVWWTNGVQAGQVTLDLEARPWCCPFPNGQPTLTLSDGALDPGKYQVAVTFLDAWGRESGAARAVPITVPANGAIALSHIPQPPVDGRVRIYMTSGNDGVLRAAVTLASGITDYVLAQPAQGRACDTLLLRPMPPGQLVAYGAGRQFVARGKELLFSPALRYGLIAPGKNRVSFVGRIDMIAFVGDGGDGAGLYVSDGKRTYFLAGADPAQWKQPIAYPYGALPGQLGWTPGDVWGLDTKQSLPVWQARDGRLVVGMPGGQVYLPKPRDITGSDAVFDQGDAAALFYRDGRVVSAIKGAAVGMRDQLIVREYRYDQ